LLLEGEQEAQRDAPPRLVLAAAVVGQLPALVEAVLCEGVRPLVDSARVGLLEEPNLAIKPLSADLDINALKDTYDSSCF
jgi:hypothetical protein